MNYLEVLVSRSVMVSSNVRGCPSFLLEEPWRLVGDFLDACKGRRRGLSTDGTGGGGEGSQWEGVEELQQHKRGLRGEAGGVAMPCPGALADFCLRRAALGEIPCRGDLCFLGFATPTFMVSTNSPRLPEGSDPMERGRLEEFVSAEGGRDRGLSGCAALARLKYVSTSSTVAAALVSSWLPTSLPSSKLWWVTVTSSGSRRSRCCRDEGCGMSSTDGNGRELPKDSHTRRMAP